MKKAKQMVCIFIAILAFFCMNGCTNKVPEEYFVDASSVKLPEQIAQGYYRLKNITALKYHNANQSIDKALYFQQIADTMFKLTDAEFAFGDNTIHSPYYREIEFNGVIRAFMGKADYYRAIEPSEVINIDADESVRSVKRCFIITKSDGSDTNYRLYMMDDEVWIAHFYMDNEVLTCEDIFVLTYDKVKTDLSDKK